MTFCRNCGKELNGQAVICPHCGVPQQTMQPQVADEGGFIYGLLSCCFPVVGLILWLIWKDTKPKTAHTAGKWALISAIVSFVLTIIYIVLIVVVGLNFGYYY